MDVYRVARLGAPLDAVVEVPGSKSVANRALVCAALAAGESVLTEVPDGDDTQAMVDCLTALGLQVEREDTTVRIEGGLRHFRKGPITLATRLAGTTSRFITAVAALGPGPYTIDGLPPLRRRPMAPLHNALRALGASVHSREPGHVPVTIEGPFDVTAEEVELRGDISSQYLSALMMVAPFFPKGLRFVLTTPLVSRPYVRVTAKVMESFGVSGIELGDRIITVPPGRYTARSYTVEPDASAASYPLAAAAICGGTVRVPGLTHESLQGDSTFHRVLARMGCQVAQDATGTTVTRNGELKGVDVDLSDLSDLVPTLAVVAPFASTTTDIHGVGFIRGKESDRLTDLVLELRKAGIDATDNPDGLVVQPSTPHSATLATHQDHRLAMSFALVGLATSGIIIEDPDVVSKSWPDFWDMIESLR